MPSFAFQHATRIFFGPGQLGELGEQAARLSEGGGVLLVTDAGVRAAGLLDRVRAALGEQPVTVVDQVSPNPRDSECQAAAQVAREQAARVVVGLGGGSVMDTAKAAAALATNGGGVKEWEDPRRLDRAPLPCICIPTTAGTGSEVTFVAVITDDETHLKMTLLDPQLAPAVAVVDPELTLTLPRGLTAATGMDALIHAIEAYTCKAANPLTDALAIRAIELIATSLERATADGGDLQARSSMALGSTVAGMAFGNSDVGAVHCLGESVGALYDSPHGVANAVFLPQVLEFNVPADPAKHADVARALGAAGAGMGDEEAAAAGIAWVRRLMTTLDLPSFADLEGVTEADFPRLAGLAAEHVCSPDNARDIDADDYLRIVRAAYAERR
jgi:alcohol dehydrogenase